MPPKLCFSKCRKLTREECLKESTMCQFIKTQGSKGSKGSKVQRRNYCRLNKLYTLDDKCNAIKKITKRERKNAAKTTRKIAAKTISKFMIKTGNKRKSLFLKSICADSGVCLAFGTEIFKINQFFGNFKNFEYAVSPIKSIGSASSNGFVKEIKYQKEGYDAYSILKSSTRQDADNLMYEYEVGQYINKQNKIFPCFLETYAAFVYKNSSAWNHVKDVNHILPHVLQNNLQILAKPDYSVGCFESTYISIMIQHIKNAIGFNELNEMALNQSGEHKIIQMFNQEILGVLYQIYMPLASMVNEFTHYDLHSGNVLLYEPVKNSYITYNYHLLSGEIVQFKSKYIAKIIDYGRSYYDDKENSSLKTYKKICKNKDCDPRCGIEYGLEILGPESSPGSFYHISSQVRNASHDLRISNGIVLPNKSFAEKIYLNDIVTRIVYKHTFGTKENMKTGGKYGPINNVVDMSNALSNIINNPSYKNENTDYYTAFKNIGEFHIFQDGRPMKFTNA